MKLLGMIGLALAALGAAANDAVQTADVTYSNQIARLVQNKCQECHRPEGVAPFELMSYRQVKGWAAMIREVVDEGRMPPWHADPAHGVFRNDRRLTDQEKADLFAWLDGGMAEGDPAALPAPRSFDGQWKIGEPDVVFDLPEEVAIPASGTVPYLYFETAPGWAEDRYVQKAQALPGNAKVVHHIIVLWKLPDGVNPSERRRDGMLVGTAPGDMPLDCGDGFARRIPAGAVLRWQMHYTPTGKAETDRSKLGLVFAKAPPTHLVETAMPLNQDLRIPAGADNHVETATHRIDRDIRILSYMPHMHYRGKAFRYEAEYPDGRREILLDVPRYDFNWQAMYYLAEPKLIPKGTTLHFTAAYDNSAANPYNPDPGATVFWGEQTWEEMMIGWHDYYVVDGSGPVPGRDGSTGE